MATIADVPTMTRQEYSIDHLSGDTPFLVLDGLAEWPANQSWTPKSVRDRGVNAPVEVLVSETGFYSWDEDSVPTDHSAIKDVALGQAADWILQADGTGKTFYIVQRDVAKTLPEIIPDLRFPAPPANPIIINLWFGSSGTVSPLHFDASNNLYAQVCGTKEFTLFAPDDGPYLYPFTEGCKMPHMSYIDVQTPDPDRYPLYSKAKPIRVTVEEGQILFLPAFWWHRVKSTTKAVSVNQWWPPYLYQYKSPTAARLLRSEYKRNQWAGIRREYGWTAPSLLYAAQTLLDINPTVATYALAASSKDCNVAAIDELASHPDLGSSWKALMSFVNAEPALSELPLSVAQLNALIQAVNGQLPASA